MRSIVCLLLVTATASASAQNTARLMLHIPSNVEVRVYAPNSARFAVDDTEPVARRDTVVLKDGAVVSYARMSGPLHFLVRGAVDGKTVGITTVDVRKSRWSAFVAHDVSIDGSGGTITLGAGPRTVAAIDGRDSDLPAQPPLDCVVGRDPCSKPPASTPQR